MATVSLTGTYRHHKNENYNDFLKALNLGWFKRHSAVRAHPVVKITEGSAGTLNFKRTCGINTTEKTISLGEEHSETLPNGDIVRVRIQSMFLKHQPIHVSETSTNPCYLNIKQSSVEISGFFMSLRFYVKSISGV